MRIGVLGAGLMSDALATRWVEAGHEVCIAGRTPAKAAALARRLGGSAAQGSFREAVEFGDVILLAVRHEGVVGTVEAAGGADGAFAGKTIIDCTNPVEVDQFTLVIDSGTSLAEEIQRLAKGSTVIKAFNLCQARVWQMRPPRFDGRVLTVPYCGDGETAKQVAGRRSGT